MSFIGKIRPSNPTTADVDYLSRLIAKTRRDNAALLSPFGPHSADDDDSGELLRALRERWPLDDFDEINVATAAPFDPRLKRALGFLGPRVRHFGGGLMLSKDNERDITRWVLTVAGREIGGLRLVRDPLGWCSADGVLQ
jgi:hypothetical protein